MTLLIVLGLLVAIGVFAVARWRSPRELRHLADATVVRHAVRQSRELEMFKLETRLHAARLRRELDDAIDRLTDSDG